MIVEFCRTGLHKSGGTDENSGDWDNSYDCYIISHQKLTFYHAQRWCSSQNIPLAEPKTDTDQENLWSKIQVAISISYLQLLFSTFYPLLFLYLEYRR